MSISEFNNQTTPPLDAEDRTINADEKRILDRTLTGGRAGEPDFVPIAPRRGSVTAQVEEIFFENFLKYFKNAEEKRRWDIEKDIPWDKTSPNSSEVTAQIVESFTAVEMYLPDYTHKIMELIRRSRGRAWFQSNWGFEESKHSIVLEEWLIRSGKRTEEQMRDFETRLLGAEWQLPVRFSPSDDHLHDDPGACDRSELHQPAPPRRVRRRRGSGPDPALGIRRRVRALQFLPQGRQDVSRARTGRDDQRHKFVFEHFAMPAHALIPEWQERGEAIEAAGIYGPKMYLAKIRRPILEDLNISRTQLKEAGLPIPEADESADRAEARAAEEADRANDRTHFVGGHPAPLMPPHRKRILPLGV
jgi:acyl-[acyl-carrier-protein] desaturase